MRSSWLRRRTAERIVIILKSGKTVRGWLDETASDGVLLRVPELLVDESPEPVALGGELFVPRENIEIVQLGVDW